VSENPIDVPAKPDLDLRDVPVHSRSSRRLVPLIRWAHAPALPSAPVSLVAFAGWINQQQRDVIEYLQTENRALGEQLGPGRLRYTDD